MNKYLYAYKKTTLNTIDYFKNIEILKDNIYFNIDEKDLKTNFSQKQILEKIYNHYMYSFSSELEKLNYFLNYNKNCLIINEEKLKNITMIQSNFKKNTNEYNNLEKEIINLKKNISTLEEHITFYQQDILCFEKKKNIIKSFSKDNIQEFIIFVCENKLSHFSSIINKIFEISFPLLKLIPKKKDISYEYYNGFMIWILLFNKLLTNTDFIIEYD